MSDIRRLTAALDSARAYITLQPHLDHCVMARRCVCGRDEILELLDRAPLDVPCVCGHHKEQHKLDAGNQQRVECSLCRCDGYTPMSLPPSKPAHGMPDAHRTLLKEAGHALVWLRDLLHREDSVGTMHPVELRARQGETARLLESLQALLRSNPGS